MARNILLQKLRQHESYLRNKDKVLAKSKQDKIEKRKYILEQKRKGCSKCQERNPLCMHFHHRNPLLKSFNIGRDRNSHTLKQIKEEILKCDILCGNCHRKEHEFDVKSTTKNPLIIRNKLWYIEYKKQCKCITCGEQRTICLDFHHITNDKFKNISVVIHYGYSINTIQKEIAKCVCLCCNCHMKLHAADKELRPNMD